jgi:hypothetical protein
MTGTNSIQTQAIKAWFEKAKKNLFITLFSCAMLIRFILSMVFIFSYIEKFIYHSGGAWFIYSLGIALLILPFIVEFSIGLVSFTTSLVKAVLGWWILAFILITIAGFSYNAFHIYEFCSMISDESLSNFVGVILHFSNFLSFVLIELMGFLVMQVESQSPTAVNVPVQNGTMNVPNGTQNVPIINDQETLWNNIIGMVERKEISMSEGARLLNTPKTTFHNIIKNREKERSKMNGSVQNGTEYKIGQNMGWE